MALEFSSTLWLEKLSSTFSGNSEIVDDLFETPEAIITNGVSALFAGRMSITDFVSGLKSSREDIKGDLLDSVLSVLWIEGNQVS